MSTDKPPTQPKKSDSQNSTSSGKNRPERLKIISPSSLSGSSSRDLKGINTPGTYLISNVINKDKTPVGTLLENILTETRPAVQTTKNNNTEAAINININNTDRILQQDNSRQGNNKHSNDNKTSSTSIQEDISNEINNHSDNSAGGEQDLDRLGPLNLNIKNQSSTTTNLALDAHNILSDSLYKDLLPANSDIMTSSITRYTGLDTPTLVNNKGKRYSKDDTNVLIGNFSGMFTPGLGFGNLDTTDLVTTVGASTGKFIFPETKTNNSSSNINGNSQAKTDNNNINITTQDRTNNKDHPNDLKPHEKFERSLSRELGIENFSGLTPNHLKGFNLELNGVRKVGKSAESPHFKNILLNLKATTDQPGLTIGSKREYPQVITIQNKEGGNHTSSNNNSSNSNNNNSNGNDQLNNNNSTTISDSNTSSLLTKRHRTESAPSRPNYFLPNSVYNNYPQAPHLPYNIKQEYPDNQLMGQGNMGGGFMRSDGMIESSPLSMGIGRGLPTLGPEVIGSNSGSPLNYLFGW